ncbi:hypothetical protein GCM10010399_93000 [Dactylosporangium fulvum]|uniref:MucR family transcriptional regulator n=1 Tax=Dactylosporangium fulvum TaxID=53359 RepID=A0ABY5WCH4_9ACTN|nr:MucR family transcriptional regulator [Dactylosporangium fulvum]UWP85826.1 MucR family transcriptional regulator [Dactylosporangium fulvum]
MKPSTAAQISAQAGALYRQGRTIAQIAAELGVTKVVARRAVTLSGTPLRNDRLRTKPAEDRTAARVSAEVARLYASGLKIRQIAAELRMAPDTVMRGLDLAGVARNLGPVRGARPEAPLDVPSHDMRGYRLGCRCTVCRAANTDNVAAQRVRRKLRQARQASVLPPEEEWRTSDGIRCLECGVWKKALGRHLPVHGLDADEYRRRWGMRQRQPLTSRELSDVRREIAVDTGGPDRLRALAPQVAPIAAAARVGRERREQERRSVRAGQQRAADQRSADADQRADAAARGLGHRDVADYMRRRYLDEGQPMRVLVAELGVNKQVVGRLMDLHGVRRRGPGPPPT